MSTTPRPLSKRAASKLWDDLKAGFVNVEAQIVKIIQARAWEPLGYATFTEAWTERLSGVRLATDECRAAVVYAMLADGADDAAVVRNTGVVDQAVARLRRQRADGVPANCASVRGHTRGMPAPPYMVTVKLGVDELDAAKAACEALGLDYADEARAAVRKHYATIERRARRVSRELKAS